MCEYDEITINGAPMCSVAVEAIDADAVLAVIEGLGLEDAANINYVQAIKNVLGLRA